MEQKLFTRNFLLLVLGQASSLFGNYILRLALSMYVLDLTGSATAFAGILSAAMIPTILLSPFGGILADRADKKRIMVALDAMTAISVLCAGIVLSDSCGVAVIGVLLVVLSILGAFETPTVQACIPQMLTGDNIIRGNAVVNQVASVSYLTAPMLGGILYGAFGLKPVMGASVLCFFATAILECFFEWEHRPLDMKEGIWTVVQKDFLASVRFIVGEKPEIFRMLLLVAFSRFFVMGVVLVGLPYIVRNILGLGAVYYGAMESMLAVAAILGGLGAGALVGRGRRGEKEGLGEGESSGEEDGLRERESPGEREGLGREDGIRRGGLSVLLGIVGFCLIPAGFVFLAPVSTMAKYVAQVICFGGMQVAITIFSIFSVSMIQQSTPERLVGKVMAYTAAITMCAQPLGQMVYGIVLDGFRGQISFILIFTGVVMGMMGWLLEGRTK